MTKHNNIFTVRQKLTPAQYQWAEQDWLNAVRTNWNHQEVSMLSDIVDWGKTDPVSKEVMSRILRGFTLLEHIIGDYWSKLSGLFGAPEIVGLCQTYSAQEVVHAYAYNFLEDSIGITNSNWKAFEQDAKAQQKLNFFYDGLIKAEPLDDELALALALFSGGGEGVSLYSSFAILLAHCQKQFRGVSQILSWSVRDEEAHSQSGIKLFKELIAEKPLARPEQELVHEGFARIVSNEQSCIHQAFGDLQELPCGLKRDDIKQFIFHRADTKLAELGYEYLYYVGADSGPVGEWFYPMVQGTTLHDFFVQRANGSGYTSTVKSFEDIDYDF